MPFNKKEYKGSDVFQLCYDLVEVVGAATCGYTNAKGEDSTKTLIFFYPWVEYNNTTEEVVEHFETYIKEQEFENGYVPSRKFSNAFDASVSCTFNVASMRDVEDTGDDLDLDEELGKLLYPQRDGMAGQSVLSVDDLLAIHSQAYVDKLVKSGNWDYNPKFLAKPLRRRGKAELKPRS